MSDQGKVSPRGRVQFYAAQLRAQPHCITASQTRRVPYQQPSSLLETRIADVEHEIRRVAREHVALMIWSPCGPAI